MNSKQLTFGLALTTLLLIGFPSSAYAGEWVSGSVTNSAGTRSYQLWVPAGLDRGKPAPLLMMLHGCMQKAEDLAAASGMNEVAEKNGFLVVYPEQATTANPLKCWNWFEPKHQEREGGEPSLLAAVVKHVITDHHVDAKRVYVVGISAGGAMAVVMGVTYPDMFHGIGVSAGLEYKAALSVETGLAAMKQGGPDPKQQAILAFKEMSKHLPNAGKAGTNQRMPVIVFQGAGDPYVNPLNAEQLIIQWAHTNNYLAGGNKSDLGSSPSETVAGIVPGGHEFTKSVYRDRAGGLLLEKWIVKGLAHAWSGSATPSPFADPKGPHAGKEIWRFFQEASLTTPAGRPGKQEPKPAKPEGGVQ